MRSVPRWMTACVLLVPSPFHAIHGLAWRTTSTRIRSSTTTISMSSTMSSSSTTNGTPSLNKGKLLVLGGTGFLGQTICRRALLEGYSVTSLSRRGLPPPSSTSSATATAISSTVTSTTATSIGGSSSITGSTIDYRKGDARIKETIADILKEGGYVGVIHCIGLLFDDASGLGNWNRFVSGSGSLPDAQSSYDSITRLSAFNAIDATVEYIQAQSYDSSSSTFPFVFTSAAEAGWPDVPGGPQIEEFLAPEWLRRYLIAKRAVEGKLLNQPPKEDQSSPAAVSLLLRPIIPRPSLIYSLDRPASYLPVGAFFVGNQVLRLPFVDRPVTVQALSNAIIKAISQENVQGILRYPQIDELSR